MTPSRSARRRHCASARFWPVMSIATGATPLTATRRSRRRSRSSSSGVNKIPDDRPTTTCSGNRTAPWGRVQADDHAVEVLTDHPGAARPHDRGDHRITTGDGSGRSFEPPWVASGTHIRCSTPRTRADLVVFPSRNLRLASGATAEAGAGGAQSPGAQRSPSTRRYSRSEFASPSSWLRTRLMSCPDVAGRMPEWAPRRRSRAHPLLSDLLTGRAAETSRLLPRSVEHVVVIPEEDLSWQFQHKPLHTPDGSGPGPGRGASKSSI